MSASLLSVFSGARMIRRLAPLLLAALALSWAVSAFGQLPGNGPTTMKPNPHLSLVIAKRGTIDIELLPQAAPKTVAHIVALANRKFYDGILFHRVIKEYIAQAGDPKTRGMDGSKLHGLSDRQVSERYGIGAGGSGQTVPLEPKLPHERGTVVLARSNQVDSGDSQFFFNLKPNHSLDQSFCVFGKIVKGLEVMDKIELGDRITSIRIVKGK